MTDYDFYNDMSSPLENDSKKFIVIPIEQHHIGSYFNESIKLETWIAKTEQIQKSYSCSEHESLFKQEVKHWRIHQADKAL